MMTELITAGELAGIERTAAKYGLRLRQPVKKYADGYPKYQFDHPEHVLWVFVIDSDWRKRRVRFQKRFIKTLQQNRILASEENGAGKNCSVEERDLDSALRVCTAALI